MIKLTEMPDGVFPRYGMKVTPENRDSPEVKQFRRERAEESRRQQDPYYVLGQYRAATDEAFAELKLKHDKPTLKKAIGMPEGVGIAMEDGRDAEQRDASRSSVKRKAARKRQLQLSEHVGRSVGDLSSVTHYAAKVEAAMKARKWKAAIVDAIWLGIAAHKALIARPLEPEVLRDRARQAGSAIGRQKTKPARAENRKQFDDLDRPRYRKRMLELRLNDIRYEKASHLIQDELREKKGDRHHARRIRELAPNPITKKNPTPPKDYVR